MNEDDLFSFFRLARSVSLGSNYKIKMGCVLIHNGKPISVGHNEMKSNPGEWSYGDKVSIHAEANCLKNCLKKNFEGATMIIYRESKDKYHMPRLAKPCPDCMKLLEKFKVKKIIYSVNEFPYWEVEWL